MSLSPLVLSLVAALSAFARQAAPAPPSPGPLASPMVGGQSVPELAPQIWSVFQAKDSTYWVGSDGQGAYRYDGKTLVQFTTG